jgi:hypothetical protein
MDDKYIKSFINRKIDAQNITLYSVIVFTFLVAFLAALTAIILSSIIWTEKTGNATICNSCEGIVTFVSTDNGTLQPIVNQSLKFRGVSGITTSIKGIDNITIDNLRDLTPYTVDINGGSEFLTPQDAYNQAVLDGKNASFPAVIIIAPGSYDFGTSQFPLTTPGIAWVASPGVTGASGIVLFISSSVSGGIMISFPFDPSLSTTILFKGITFGAINDNTGFLINHTQGYLNLVECGCINSNFRIVLGGAGIATFSYFTSTLSYYQPLAPSDFITTVSTNVAIILQYDNIFQFNSIYGTGGSLLNAQLGLQQIRFISCFILYTHYDEIIQGASSGNFGGLIQFENSYIEGGGVNQNTAFYLQGGAMVMQISSSSITVQGSLILQAQDSLPGEQHVITVKNSNIITNNSTVYYNSSLTTTGNINCQFLNCYLEVDNTQYIINIQSATTPDTLNFVLSQTLIKTAGSPGSDFAIGPGPLLATIQVGSSNCLNSCTTVNNMNYVTITSI